jgi:hypothetical protein
MVEMTMDGASKCIQSVFWLYICCGSFDILDGTLKPASLQDIVYHFVKGVVAFR